MTPPCSTRPKGVNAWRDLAACLSLANLSYLRVWSELLTYRPEDAFYMKEPPSSPHYAAAALNTLLLGGIFWIVLRWLRRRQSRRWFCLAEWVFPIVLLFPLNAIRHVASNESDALFRYLRAPLIGLLNSTAVIVFASVVGAIAVPAAVRWRGRIVRAAFFGLQLLFPLVPIVLAQGAWKALHTDLSAFAAKSPARRIDDPAQAGPRVLWILFDEWDQRLTFEDRRRDLLLPELDSFRRTAIYVPNSLPPSSRTLCSVPALLTGRSVSDAQILTAEDLFLSFDDGAPGGMWSRESSIFTDVRDSGLNVSVVGWYLPYCRALGADLTACWWWDMSLQHNSVGDRLREILPNQALSLLETTQLAPGWASRATQRQARTYSEILDRALTEASDRRHGFVFMHLPVPHSPHTYDRRTQSFTLYNSPIAGYWDSLALLDKSLGELRRAMEHFGVWDSTAILLSSDHWNRSSRGLDGREDHRVPFLLKLPGQDSGLVVEERIQTILTRDLLRAIVRRELVTPAGAAEWLSERGRRQLKDRRVTAEVVRREAY